MDKQEPPDPPQSPAAKSQARKTAPPPDEAVTDIPTAIPHRAAHPFPIVAIGASAGGLEALEQFFSGVAPGCGMAFVVIQHLDPDHKGMLPELLDRATPLPVAQAKSRMSIQPDHVYVIPPNKDMSILHDRLYLLDPVAPRGLRLPIDFFFRALADERHESAICVTLSGMGSDGTLGLRAIKEHGGLVLAQDPATAKFDSMPRSAIDTGLVDIVATARELPARIHDYLSHASWGIQMPPLHERESAEQKSSLDKIVILLRARNGHDFSHYKKSTVYRRIERRMVIHQLNRISDYVRFLRENPQEVDLLFKELLIGVTNFFRDLPSWDYLRENALPELLAGYPAGSTLRAWVVGCSTGEEAYTLAMTFVEAREKLRPPKRCSLQIFATDLDADAITKARQGCYPANIAADVSSERLARFFVEDGAGFRVGKEIREMVVFAQQNVIMDPPFTKLDMLTCRNLLIYFDAELQKTLFPLFHYSLKPGSILLLGIAESIGNFSELFEPLEKNLHLFLRSNRPVDTLAVDFPTRNFPTKMRPPMDTTNAPATTSLQSLADQMLLQKFAPAAVLINGDGDIIYISGRTGKYLEPAAGKANWNIHAMAREGLRQEIAVALPKALRGGEPVTCHNLCVGTNGGTQFIDLTLHPIDEPAALRGMAMVVFADIDAPPVPGNTTGKPASRSQRTQELEQALLHAQQELRSVHEEMQSSQEELKSANEELQSTNEELQSTNEELTTSKEEMQSLNEELQTMNVEMQSKLDELSAANNDMKNLLNATDIATIFLDQAMHVRRFTTQSTRLFKLIPGDVGRPLSDIATGLAYPDLLDDARKVLETLVFSEREIATADERWFQVKIMPYRTQENVINGVVITFNDISRAKVLEAKLRALAATTEESQ